MEIKKWKSNTKNDMDIWATNVALLLIEEEKNNKNICFDYKRDILEIYLDHYHKRVVFSLKENMIETSIMRDYNIRYLIDFVERTMKYLKYFGFQENKENNGFYILFQITDLY